MVPRKNLSRCFGTTYRKGRDKPNMPSLPWSPRKSSSWLQEASLRLACCHWSPGHACQRGTSSVMLDSWSPYLGTSWLHSHSNLWWISSTRSGKSHRNMLVTQSCLILCDPRDCSLPSSFVSGVLQARTLGWLAMPFSRGSSQSKDQTWFSCIAGRFFTICATREVTWWGGGWCHYCQWAFCACSSWDGSTIFPKSSAHSIAFSPLFVTGFLDILKNIKLLQLLSKCPCITKLERNVFGKVLQSRIIKVKVVWHWQVAIEGEQLQAGGWWQSPSPCGSSGTPAWWPLSSRWVETWGRTVQEWIWGGRFPSSTVEVGNQGACPGKTVICFFNLCKEKSFGDFQWLRLGAPNAGVLDSIPGQGTRPQCQD